MDIAGFIEQVNACRPTVDELRARYGDADYEQEVYQQFDVKLVSASKPSRNHLETLITNTTLHELSFARLRWFRALQPLAGLGAEDVLEFASLREECLCVSPDFTTLFYFDYHDLLDDPSNVVSWSYQDASFLEAVLFLLRLDTAFEYRDQVPGAGADRKLRDLLGEGSDRLVKTIMAQYTS